MKLRTLMVLVAPLTLIAAAAAPSVKKKIDAERREEAEREEHARALAERPLPVPLREPDDDDDDHPKRDHEYARKFPTGKIPEHAYVRAREAWATIPHARRSPKRPPHADGSSPPDPSSLTWTLLGPAPLDLSKGVESTPNMGPTGGRASSIAIDPTDTATMYAGYAIGGVWKTTDGGATWKPIFDDQPSLAVGAIALDPADPESVFVGTGEPALYGGYFGAGIYRSSDAGATFARVDGKQFDGLSISRLVFDGSDLYAAAVFGGAGRGEGCANIDAKAKGQGLFLSKDHGATWQVLKDGSIVDVEIDTSVTPRRILISDVNDGVFRSTDGGATWTQPTGFPAEGFYARVELAIAPSDPSIVWAGMGVTSATNVLVSNDYGATFAQVPNPPNYCPNQCYWDNTLLVDPTDPGRVYTGGSICGIWGTADGLDPAPTFDNLSAFKNGDCGKQQANWYLGYVHPDVHFGAFAPDDNKTAYFATDGGIVKTSNQGASWQRLTQGVSTIQLYGLCLDPNDKDIVYGGAQDNGSFKRTGDTLTWTGIISGDGGPCAVDSGDPKTVLMSNDEGFLYVAHDGFQNLTPTESFNAAEGCTPSEPGCGDKSAFIVPVAGDPSTKGVFYTGTTRLWKNTQGGDKAGWKAISGDLTKKMIACNVSEDSDVLTAIVVAPSDPNTIYTGSAGGSVQVTRDGGATWTAVDRAPLPGRWVSSIAVDGSDPATVYVAYSGFNANTPDTPGHVFSSKDAGATWKSIDVPLDIPVDSILANPTGPGLLYAGTDTGVLVSIDAGESWQVLGDALPNAPVYALAYHQKGGRLVAGTYGRSVWAMDFTPGELSISPTSLSFSAAIGDPDPTAKVTATSSEPYASVIQFSVTADQAWVSPSAASSSTAGAQGTVVSITAKIDDLAPGTYDAKLTFTPSNAAGDPIVVPVHLDLSQQMMKSMPPNDDDNAATSNGGCGCDVARPTRPLQALVVLAALAGLAFSRRRREETSDPS